MAEASKEGLGSERAVVPMMMMMMMMITMITMMITISAEPPVILKKVHHDFLQSLQANVRTAFVNRSGPLLSNGFSIRTI
jgi:hypothetical protein